MEASEIDRAPRNDPRWAPAPLIGRSNCESFSPSSPFSYFGGSMSGAPMIVRLIGRLGRVAPDVLYRASRRSGGGRGAVNSGSCITAPPAALHTGPSGER